MYQAGFVKNFELLADWPLIGGSADDFGNGYRRFRWKSHFIIYMPNGSDASTAITIDKIVHTAMRSRSDPFEQD